MSAMNQDIEETKSETTTEQPGVDSSDMLLFETEIEKELPNQYELGRQLQSTKENKKVNLHHSLPSPKSIRSAHHVISAFL